MKKKSTICLVVPTLTGGGMERIVSELANYFVSQDYRVAIVFLLKNEPFYKLDDNIECFYPTFDYDKQAKFRPLYWMKILFYLRKTIKGISASAVFTVPQDYCILTIIALLGLKKRIIISDRSSPNLPVSKPKLLARKLFYPLASGIVAQTEFAKAKMKELGIKNEHIKVIPNPLRTIDVNKDLSKVNYKVINVGRYVNEKNQLALIQIFSAINMRNWELHFYGKGPLQKQLKDAIVNLGMEDHIFLNEPTKAIDAVLATSDIFAFTSIFEGFPNALSEAMAAPCACIAYDCPAGPSDIILDTSNGFVIPLHDTETYTTKLRMLMSDKELRMQFMNASIHNRKVFNKEIIAKKYLDFIIGAKESV